MINIRKLEADLWESADLLRAGSKLTSNQYCMPVLGLIFLRYAYSDWASAAGAYSSKRFDISNIDFDILIREFAKTKKQNLVMKDLQDLIQVRLESMMVSNPRRIDYLLRYQ